VRGLLEESWRIVREGGPVLRKLREQFFKATTKVFDADPFYDSLRGDMEKLRATW